MESVNLLADNYNIAISSITPSSLTFDTPNLTKTLQISFTYTNTSGSTDINLSDIKLSYKKVVLSKFSNTQITTDELTENFELPPAPVVDDTVVTNVYLSPSDFIITTAGETKIIKVVTVNSKNIGISTNLTIEQLNNADNVDYGSFDATSLTTDASGSGSITYTAPDDISGLSSRSIIITEASTSIQKTLQVNFAHTTDPNVTAYEISTVVPDSISLESDDTFVIKIQKVGNPNVLISDSDVKSVNVSTQFGQQLTIVESSYSDASTKTINVTTHSLSATVIVDVSAVVFDGTKDVTLTANLPITILSGPVAAVSLFYVSTEYDSSLGIFKDKYTIHAVDKFSNPVSSGVQLYPTLINGFKTVSHGGEIVVNGNTSFKDSSASFDTNVNLSDDDHLIILPSSNAFNKDYLGGWTVNSVTDKNNLALVEDYFGTDTSSLWYVIGNKSRFVGSTVALADIQNIASSYLTDKNGNTQFIVTYDPILVGHTLTLSAVAYAQNSRSGIALLSNFRGQGYEYTAEGVPNDGATHNSTVSIAISPSGSGPLANVDIVPSSVSVSPIEECSIGGNSNFTTDNNGQFTVSVNTNAIDTTTNPSCTVSWIANNSSIYYEYN
jgi:hypothetical protein